MQWIQRFSLENISKIRVIIIITNYIREFCARRYQDYHVGCRQCCHLSYTIFISRVNILAANIMQFIWLTMKLIEIIFLNFEKTPSIRIHLQDECVVLFHFISVFGIPLKCSHFIISREGKGAFHFTVDCSLWTSLFKYWSMLFSRHASLRRYLFRVFSPSFFSRPIFYFRFI